MSEKPKDEDIEKDVDWAIKSFDNSKKLLEEELKLVEEMKKYEKPLKDRNHWVNRQMFKDMTKEEVWDYFAKKQKTNGHIMICLVIGIYALLLVGLVIMTGVIDRDVPDFMGQELCEENNYGEYLTVRWNEGRYVQVVCEEDNVNIPWSE